MWNRRYGCVRFYLRQGFQWFTQCAGTRIGAYEHTGAVSVPVLLVPGEHFWLDVTAMVLFGLGIGVLICFLGGLMAVDIAPKAAAGAALGVVGIASYLGAGLQDVMNGILIEGNKTVVNGTEVYDFSMVNWFWIGSAFLSVILTALVWNAKRND